MGNTWEFQGFDLFDHFDLDDIVVRYHSDGNVWDLLVESRTRENDRVATFVAMLRFAC